MQMKNPAALVGSAIRVQNIKALAGVDVQNPTEIHPDIQSELLAVATVMRHCRVSFHHAKVVCQLSGLGGAA